MEIAHDEHSELRASERMINKKLIVDVEKNVKYQINKISEVFDARKFTNLKYLNEFLHTAQEIDENNSVLNQALSDSLLNLMASLIDYYSICCMLKLGAAESKIRKVQYRPLNNAFLIDKSSLAKPDKETATIDTLVAEYKNKLSINPQLKSIDVHDYWLGFLGGAISHTLKEYGALEDSDFELCYDEEKRGLKIDPKVEKYYFYMRPFFCNPANSSGVKHSIYIDVNNFLKHNAVPYLSTQVEEFEGEGRIFSYFEIKSEHGLFLKDGVLKDLVISDFDELKCMLELKKANLDNWDHLCELESRWGMGRVLTIDPVNDYVSRDNEFLYFYVDSVLLAKSKTAVLVDAEKSFFKVLQELRREVERGLDFFKD